MPVLQPFFPDAHLAGRAVGDFRLDLGVVDAGVMSTLRYQFTSPDSSATSDGSGVVTIGHVLVGAVRLSAGKTEIDTSKPFLIPPRPFLGEWDDVHVGGLTLDLDELQRFAGVLTGSSTHRLAFTGISPGTPALERFWRSTVRTLNRDLLRDDEAMASPLIRHAAFEQLALAVLTVFPNTTTELRGPPGAGAAVPAAVRRATAFVDEHLDSPITVPDIAAAAGLSVRGLSSAFRRHLDTTPTAYLRAGRLAAAHRDLLDSDPASGVTVTVVARRWGFANLGRFAVAHREQYGTDPGATLRG